MLVLVLDSSTPVVAVGLGRVDHDGRHLLCEVSVTEPGASTAMLPAVESALSLAGHGLEDVDEIVVGTGPGTFTGIRIAAATARSLAFGTGAKLSVNSTLAALAAPALDAAPEVLAVLDAKRKQVFAQRFDRNGARGDIVCALPEELAGMEEMVAGVPLLFGDGAVRYRDVLGGMGEIAGPGSPLHRVTAGGHLASAGLEPVPPEKVVPLYVREPDAEVRRDLNPWSAGRE